MTVIRFYTCHSDQVHAFNGEQQHCNHVRVYSMKILSPVKSIPESGYQKGVSTKRQDYDDILQRAREIEVGESLPIECESGREVDRIRTGLINRLQNGNHGEMSVWIRGDIVYAARNR